LIEDWEAGLTSGEEAVFGKDGDCVDEEDDGCDGFLVCMETGRGQLPKKKFPNPKNIVEGWVGVWWRRTASEWKFTISRAGTLPGLETLVRKASAAQPEP